MGMGGGDASCCVAEVMGTDLFTLTPDTVVASALRLATAKSIHHFLVIENGNLTGIVCDDDLRLARASTMVGACMKSPVLCIGPDTTVEDAASIMEENEVGCLPVITGAFLVGMITKDRLPSTTPATSAKSERRADGPAARGPQAENETPTCAACGTPRNVRPNLRAGMIPMCVECAGTMPTPGASKGN